MALSAGMRLGPYEVLGQIGAGGMGEVYKATDTRLDRWVAIKVLPPHLSGSEHRARFEREARTIAGLSHPHICSLFDIGQHESMLFLVMEYLAGETLADRLRKGALPLEQALEFGAQIAEALAAAHRAGIIHRDLKPGNVMVTKSGVKLLDFGLAKLRAPAAEPALATTVSLSTGLEPLTGRGTVLGTLQYMAPEQLEGKDADARTDIWALGLVLYEMVSGRRAFEATSGVTLIGAILERQPAPLSGLQPAASAALVRLIDKCLAKDPDARWDSAHDVADELRWLANGTSAAPGERGGTRRSPKSSALRSAGWFVAGLACAAILAGIVSSRRAVPPPAETRLDVAAPSPSNPFAFALSDDGRRLVFEARSQAGSQLWVRDLARETSRALPGTAYATYPFWSPDGRSVAFFAGGKLKRIDIEAGVVRTVADAPAPRRGAWSGDGTILLGSASGPLQSVPAEGGAVRPATALLAGQNGHRFPQFLADGRTFLVFALGAPGVRGIYQGVLGSTSVRRVIETEAAFGFLAPEHVLLAQQGALWAQKVDRETGTPAGSLLPVASRVLQHRGILGLGAFSGSHAGSLAYRASAGRRQLAWLDREGRVQDSIGEADETQLELWDLSSDGRTAAVARVVQGNVDVWLVDLIRGVMRRVTSRPDLEDQGLLSPDGSRILYVSDQNTNVADLYEATEDGGVLLLQSDENKRLRDWSPDGQHILYANVSATTDVDLWVLPIAGDRTPVPVARTRFSEDQGRFSPDGRWIAYRSTETGRPEIFVQPFGHQGQRVQVSLHGGDVPRWRQDGRELFYRDLDDRVMALSVQTTDSRFRMSDPRALFTLPPSGYLFEPSPDGQRFLVAMILSDVSPITIVLNWRPPGE